MPNLRFKDTNTGEWSEASYPDGVPLPKANDQIFAPHTGRVVKVLDVVGGKDSPVEIHYIE